MQHLQQFGKRRRGSWRAIPFSTPYDNQRRFVHSLPCMTEWRAALAGREECWDMPFQPPTSANGLGTVSVLE